MTDAVSANLANTLAPDRGLSGVIAMLVPELEMLSRVIATSGMMFGAIKLLGQRLHAYSGFFAPFGGPLEPVGAPAAQVEALMYGSQQQVQVRASHQRATRGTFVGPLAPTVRQMHSLYPSGPDGSWPRSTSVPPTGGQSVSAKTHGSHGPATDAPSARVPRSALASRSRSSRARDSANPVSTNAGLVVPAGLETDKSSQAEVHRVEGGTTPSIAPATASPVLPDGSVPFAEPDSVPFSVSAEFGGAIATGMGVTTEALASRGQISWTLTDALGGEPAERSRHVAPGVTTSAGPDGLIATTGDGASWTQQASVATPKNPPRLRKETIELLGASWLGPPYPMQDGMYSETSTSTTATLPTDRASAAQSPSISMPTSQGGSSHDEPDSLPGVVVLDGARIGRWMIDQLEHHASRPRAMTTGIDPRISATYPGAPTGV